MSVLASGIRSQSMGQKAPYTRLPGPRVRIRRSSSFRGGCLSRSMRRTTMAGVSSRSRMPAAEGGGDHVDELVIVQELVDRPKLGVSPPGHHRAATLRRRCQCAYARRTIPPPSCSAGLWDSVRVVGTRARATTRRCCCINAMRHESCSSGKPVISAGDVDKRPKVCTPES